MFTRERYSGSVLDGTLVLLVATGIEADLRHFSRRIGERATP